MQHVVKIQYPKFSNFWQYLAKMKVILKTADDDNVDVETDRAEEHGERWCLGAHTPATTERLRVGARAFYHLTVTFDAGPPAGERERDSS